LLRARDTGELAATGKLFLKQDAGQPVPGFSMYLPLYRPGLPRDNAAQRQAALFGWIGGPFHAQDLRDRRSPANLEQIAYELHDGPPQGSNSLLFASAEPLPDAPARQSLLQGNLPVQFAGQHWTLHAVALADFGPAAVRQRPWLVASVGVMLSTLAAISTLLFSLYLSRRALLAQQREELAQASGREAARHEAEKVLRDSEFAARMALDRSTTLSRKLEDQQQHLEQHYMDRDR